MKKLKKTLCLLLAVALFGATLCAPAAAEESPTPQSNEAAATSQAALEDGAILYSIYIRKFTASIEEISSTMLHFSATVHTFGGSYTYRGTVTVQKKVGNTYINIDKKTTTYSGAGPFTFTYGDYVHTTGTYRAYCTVEVLSGSTVLETQSRASTDLTV